MNINALKDINRSDAAKKLKQNIGDEEIKAFVAKQIAEQLTTEQINKINTEENKAELLKYIKENILK